VFLSLLVLTAEKGGYYQSAGTTPEGMQRGASHLLLYETAMLLQQETCTLFNLGGAGAEDSGLRRFKAGACRQATATVASLQR